MPARTSFINENEAFSSLGKSAQLDVQPSDTVKAVKQKIIALHSPPDWANTALLSSKGSSDYLHNKLRLSQCGIEAGGDFN